MTYWHLTHTDLDGVGCAVVARYLLNTGLPEYNIQDVSYEGDAKLTVDKAVRAILRKIADEPKDQISSLLITDIAPSADVCEELNQKRNSFRFLRVLDHHKTTMDTAAKYDWFSHENNRCGTLMTFSDLMFDPFTYTSWAQALSEFCMAVDAYDRWDLQSPYRKRGEDLQMLFKFLGFEKFLNCFSKNLSFDAEPFSTQVLRVLYDKRSKQIDNILLSVTPKDFHKDTEGHTFAFLLLGEDGSEIANRLLTVYPELDYVAFCSPFFNTLSFRSGGSVDVSALAKRINVGGGGHIKASGCPYPIADATKAHLTDVLMTLD